MGYQGGGNSYNTLFNWIARYSPGHETMEAVVQDLSSEQLYKLVENGDLKRIVERQDLELLEIFINGMSSSHLSQSLITLGRPISKIVDVDKPEMMRVIINHYLAADGNESGLNAMLINVLTKDEKLFDKLVKLIEYAAQIEPKVSVKIAAKFPSGGESLRSFSAPRPSF